MKTLTQPQGTHHRRGGKDELLQRIPKVVKTGNVPADDLEFFRLPHRESAIHSLLNLLRRSLAERMKEGLDIKGFSRMLQQLTDNGGRALAEHVTEHVIQFEVGNGETVLGAVLLSGSVPDELLVVTAQVAQLANILRRDEAAANQIVLEKVGNPHSILLIRLLALDGFDELGMRNDDVEVLFKDVVNREPIMIPRKTVKDIRSPSLLSQQGFHLSAFFVEHTATRVVFQQKAAISQRREQR